MVFALFMFYLDIGRFDRGFLTDARSVLTNEEAKQNANNLNTPDRYPLVSRIRPEQRRVLEDVGIVDRNTDHEISYDTDPVGYYFNEQFGVQQPGEALTPLSVNEHADNTFEITSESAGAGDAYRETYEDEGFNTDVEREATGLDEVEYTWGNIATAFDDLLKELGPDVKLSRPELARLLREKMGYTIHERPETRLQPDGSLSPEDAARLKTLDEEP